MLLNELAVLQDSLQANSHCTCSVWYLALYYIVYSWQYKHNKTKVKLRPKAICSTILMSRANNILRNKTFLPFNFYLVLSEHTVRDHGVH